MLGSVLINRLHLYDSCDIFTRFLSFIPHRLKYIHFIEILLTIKLICIIIFMSCWLHMILVIPIYCWSKNFLNIPFPSPWFRGLILWVLQAIWGFFSSFALCHKVHQYWSRHMHSSLPFFMLLCNLTAVINRCYLYEATILFNFPCAIMFESKTFPLRSFLL